MQPARSPREVNEAIQSLLRIRGTETKPDPKGLRTVWHQGGQGADLISYVDAKGRVIRQEFTLFDEHFLWAHDKGLRTGTVSGESGSAGVKATPIVSFDPEIEYERVERANQALGAYTGDDRYILHLKRLFALMLQGLQSTAAEEVTSVKDSEQKPAPPPPSKSSTPLVMAALGGGVLVLMLGAIALFLLRR